VIWPTARITLLLRLPATVSAAIGLIAIMAAVGALFPAIGHTIGKIDVPTGVSNMLGGADYGTITGWFGSEIGSIYGPLVIGGLVITGASAATAGEEEDRILVLVLAYPIRRARWLGAKAAAIGVVALITAFATWLGLLVGVAAAGGGITIAHMTAFAVQLAFFGFVTGALAIALGAGTGRRSFTTGTASAVAVVGWLIYSFAPLVSSIAWLEYLSPYYYYARHDPLSHGLDIVALIVLGVVTVLLIAIGMLAIERRDIGT
jgi:ABC-2 type transport system permease protein